LYGLGNQTLFINPIEPGSPQRGTSKATGDGGATSRHDRKTFHFQKIFLYNLRVKYDFFSTANAVILQLIMKVPATKSISVYVGAI